MSDDEKLAFLDQPRDDQGRFATKSEPAPVEPAPPPEPTPQPEPPQAVQPEPAPAPNAAARPTDSDPQKSNDPAWAIAKALDEREKRQKLEAELASYKQRLEEATRKPVEAIDPVMDPEGYERSINQRIEQAKWDTKTEVSLAFAMQRHGAQVVEAAKSWVEQKLTANPSFWLEIQRQSDPYDFVIKQHKREQSFAKIGDDEPETWAEKWARENGYVKAGEVQPAAPVAGSSPQQGTPPPRPSLASAPSAGGGAAKVPMGGQAAYEAVFKS